MWRWGNRAHGEVAEFVGKFMVEQTRMADVEKEEGAGESRSDGRRRGKPKNRVNVTSTL